MRSVPAGSFARVSSPAALWRAWGLARRGKLRRPEVAAFDLDADRHLFALVRRLGDGSYRPGAYRLRVVHDPKLRLIAAAPLIDRVLHRAVVEELAPHFEPSFIDTSYACGTGRGPARALLCYLGWMRCYRFRLTLDVRRYFPSIRRDRLLDLLFRRLTDLRMRVLLSSLVEAGGAVYRDPLAIRVLHLDEQPLALGAGLPLGSALSHWVGGFYLDGLDHFVKRELKIPAYLRYADDMALFADDRSQLEAAHVAIASWLERERGLELKPSREGVVAAARPGVFLGYRVGRAGVRPGPRLRRRMRTRVRDAAARGPEALTRTLRAYAGIVGF